MDIKQGWCFFHHFTSHLSSLTKLTEFDYEAAQPQLNIIAPLTWMNFISFAQHLLLTSKWWPLRACGPSTCEPGLLLTEISCLRTKKCFKRRLAVQWGNVIWWLWQQSISQEYYKSSDVGATYLHANVQVSCEPNPQSAHGENETSNQASKPWFVEGGLGSLRLPKHRRLAGWFWPVTVITINFRWY